jgi:tripartite-type tricarboxylate transporter receptor subunit TctC
MRTGLSRSLTKDDVWVAAMYNARALICFLERSILPDVSVLSEFLPGYDVAAWNGLGAPKDTPPEIIGKLNKEINAALADPKLKGQFAELGSSVVGGPPADYANGEAGASTPGWLG